MKNSMKEILGTNIIIINLIFTSLIEFRLFARETKQIVRHKSSRFWVALLWPPLLSRIPHIGTRICIGIYLVAGGRSYIASL